MRVTGRTLIAWLSILVFFLATHLSILERELLESWYGPLHVLWLAACGGVVSFWCLRTGVERWPAMVQTAVFVLFSYGITLAAVRIDWGGGVVGESRLSLIGSLLIGAAWSLVLVPVVFDAVSLPAGRSVRAGGDRS